MAKRPQRKAENKSPLVDFFMIAKYVALFIVFALIVYGMDTIVLSALHQSPTGQAGNGYINLQEVHNTGAAFNLFAGHPEMIITASFMAVAVLAFVVLVFSGKLTQTAVSAMALLSAGITMNMVARIQHGYVIDYINCTFLQGFPIFNTADMMIVIGALGLVLSLFTRR